jgi:hypothetical protein
MVKRINKYNSKEGINKGSSGNAAEASKIGPSTPYGFTSQRLTAFGGLLGLIKFMDLVKFQEIFDSFYNPPMRTPKLGHYKMLLGLLMLLFIGFNRIWHFKYIQRDSMLCSFFNVLILPYVTTYWRYVNSLGLNQGKCLLNLISALRERVWHLCEINYESIHIDIDPTVETIYGNQQGGRKGHNRKHRGKKGFRPVLCFIEETREYLFGKLRVGKTMSGEESAKLIYQLKRYIPGCVKNVILRGDSELMCGESVKAAKEEGYNFIFGNKGCKPSFDESKWHNVRRGDGIEYNDCIYQPSSFEEACRFVAMRIPKDESVNGDPVQLALIEEVKFKYRIFATDLPGKAHKIIKEYDKRADCENLIGESSREGLSAIPSGKFSSNYAYFQIVMLSYNIWRSLKMLAVYSEMKEISVGKAIPSQENLTSKDIVNNTIRIARLKLLLIAAKITNHSNVTEVKYSEQDSRSPGLFKFFRYMDKRRKQLRPWLAAGGWECNHLPLLAQNGSIG